MKYAGRLQVEFVLRHKGLALRSQQGQCALIEIGLAQQIVLIDFAFPDAWQPSQIEAALGTEVFCRLYLGSGVIAIFHQQGAGLPAANEHDLQFRRLTATPLQGIDCRREQFQGIPGRQFYPAGDGQITPWPKTLQIQLQCFHGIKVAFVQGVQPCRRGIEGIQQSQLDQIVALPAAAKKIPGFGNMQGNIVLPVESAAETAKGVVDQIDQLRIDFQRIDFRDMVIISLQYIGAASGTDHQDPLQLLQMIG